MPIHSLFFLPALLSLGVFPFPHHLFLWICQLYPHCVSFLRAAITNYHKFGGLKQHKFILTVVMTRSLTSTCSSLGKICSMPLSQHLAAVGSPWSCFACGCITPVSVSIFTCPCLCLSHISISFLLSVFGFRTYPITFLLLFCRQVVSYSLWPCGPQHARLLWHLLVSWSLLRFMSIELMVPCNHLILCSPFSFYLPSYPAPGFFLRDSKSRMILSQDP